MTVYNPDFLPRFYQQEAHDAVIDAIFAPRLIGQSPVHPVVGIPTGGGKSSLLGMLCFTILARIPWARIAVMAHVKELIGQNRDDLLMVWPTAPHGIYSAGLNERDASKPITLSSIQTAIKDPTAFGKINILLIDECQMVSEDEASNYRKFIKKLEEINPNLIVIGLSATLYRRKTGTIIENGIFNRVVYDITGKRAFQRLIELGYLVRLSAKPTSFTFDVSDVSISAGDFNQTELQELVDVDPKTRVALAEALERGWSRKHWIIFCAGIQHITNVHRILTQEYGESATFVHSKMKKSAKDPDIDTRDRNVAAFKAGEYRMIISDNILTTGFNAPFVDHIVTLRPTRSVVRHVQGLGRGTRPYYAPGCDLSTAEGRLFAIEASGRSNCLVSDFGGNIERLGPVNDPKMPGKKGKLTGEMPVKICETHKLIRGVGCGEYNFCSARFCEECGAEFKFDLKISKEAATAEPVAMDKPEYRWYNVDRVEYQPYRHRGGYDALMVWYFCGAQRFSEIIGLGSDVGAIYRRTNKWWNSRVPFMDVPQNTLAAAEALKHVPTPTQIRVCISMMPQRVMQAAFNNQEPVDENADEQSE